MIQDLSDDKAFVELTEAQRQGHKFMKIYLHRSKIQKGQRKIIISGAVTLHGVRIGLDQFGGAEYRFEEKRGDSMIFQFDSMEREYICYLYDDPGRGYFSPNGYNRDLLASHFDQDFFVIKDANLHADIKLRYERMKSNPAPFKAMKAKDVVNANINSGMTVEDIDSQIEFLHQRKEQIIKVNAENAQDEILKAKAYEEKKKEQEKLDALSKKKQKTPNTGTKKSVKKSPAQAQNTGSNNNEPPPNLSPDRVAAGELTEAG